MDNYTHQLRVSMPTADSGLWRNTNWSAKALISLRSLQASTLFLREGAPDAILPIEDVFADEVTTRFQKYYLEQEQEPVLCFEASVSKDVREIPIKLDNKTTQDADLDRKFIPLAILKQNIGSNAGLLSLLKEWRVEEHGRAHTPALLVDVNIYWRVMKVLSCFC